MMTEQELHQVLSDAVSLPAETEIVEFKEAKESYAFDKIGQYFSALSNEANLKGKTCGWLIFGIENSKHQIVGSRYRTNRKDLDSLKKEVGDKTTNNISFVEIYELKTPKRVVMFQIPAAPQGIPIAFEGFYYGRANESLVALNIEKIERIRNQALNRDWSRMIIPDASMEDLDETAMLKARNEFIIRNPKYASEIEHWDNSTFLNKAKLTLKGKITNTAMILLGKDECEHYINPSVAKIRWLLRTVTNQDKDFEIFGMPLILTVDEVLAKIRNLKYRYLRDGTLFPDEALRYEPFSIRELLNNAIAHQDYTKGARINVVEFEDDHLVFTNYGTFIPESVESVVLKDSPEEYYRNPFLVEAMKNLNMIDTQGGGIRKIFNYQRKRFFPMPDYNFPDGKVKVTLTGKIVDENFAKILINNPELNLEDIIILDKVQKNKNITEEAFLYLRKNKFIEGRKPKVYLSYKVIKPTENEELMAEYVTNKSFDDEYFKKLIFEYIKKQGNTSRKAIDKLIRPKLSAALTEEQKKNKITNFLSALRMRGKIKNLPGYLWEIV